MNLQCKGLDLNPLTKFAYEGHEYIFRRTKMALKASLNVKNWF
jgi:hypothetical protein